MKKINVSKLIDLRNSENVALNVIKNWSDSQSLFAQKRFDEAKTILAEVREQFAVESEKLVQVIAEAEGNRVSVRKIDVKDIIDDLIEINEYFGITKKSMKGTTVLVDHNAQTFPTAYKGTPESTHFRAEFTTNWFVTSIRRERCIPKKFHIKLSETAKEEYLKNAETLA